MCRAATGIRVMATINHKACIVFGGQKAHMRRVQHRRFSNPFGDYLVGRCVKPWLFWLNPDPFHVVVASQAANSARA